MGRPGACNVCCRSDRKALDDAHRGGTPTRSLARDFGVAESSLRKHFRHARPKPTPVAVARPAPVTAPADEPSVSYQKVKKAAEYLGLPLSRFAACIEDHVGYSITTSSEDELDELHAAWAATDDDDEYIGTIIRNGKFHEETA